MFSVNAGWLTYEPFSHYQLPKIVHAGEGYEPVEAVFFKSRSGPLSTARMRSQQKKDFGMPMYRLEWPGRMSALWHPEEDTISHEILQNWGITGGSGLDLHSRFLPNKPCSLKWMVGNGMQLPSKGLPPAVAYHVAVNLDRYLPNPTGYYPIGALPGKRVDQVLNARFALDGKTLATLQYLKWHAEGHYWHPLFRGFDTMMREMLMGISHKSAQLYFKLLGDCLYDESKKWWERKPYKHHWWRMAGYVHWLSRTGSGLVHTRDFSDLEGGWDDHPEMEDVRLAFKEWQKVEDDIRGMAHVTGKIPGVAGDLPIEGPVKEEDEFPFEEDLIKLVQTYEEGKVADSREAWKKLEEASCDLHFDLGELLKHYRRSHPSTGQGVDDLVPVTRIRAPSGAAKKGRTLVEDPFGEDLIALAHQFEHGEPEESMEAWVVLTQRAKDEEFVLRDLFNYARDIPVEELPASANPQTVPV